MGLLGVSSSLPRQGWVVIRGSQATLQSRWSLEKIQLTLLLSEIATDTTKRGKEGEQLYTRNSSFFLDRGTLE